jgi:hypothetical protein
MKLQRLLSISALGILIPFALNAAAYSAACTPPKVMKTATAKEIRRFVKARKMDVLTFAGYSGAGYENPAGMLETAEEILGRHDPRKTLVNVGATAEGIGAVYEIAKKKGFKTSGIVSALAAEEKVPLSPCVDYLFFVKDRTWGGNLPNTRKLSPTSATIVTVSTEMVGIGGGEVARDELLAARKAGKPVTFIPADLNHGIAREKAAKKALPEPSDFRGAAAAALGKAE